MTNTAQPAAYTVVARRYRPQVFEDLVGQASISQALCNAIATQRVGHAYLFTGARGTGKTSTARIFCKALCCVHGPTATPCNQCDICQGISGGDDIDILEIDGASNRGIDEIRQLRANVNIRPSRARYKIYIIDEVHMLTAPAFNALLKTLEEPPAHVKFVFCTTDPEKMPITVLSRCQRYDFAPVERAEIVKRLAAIVTAEHRQADIDALEILGQRAAGSMRDSQSLLEQLLAFGGERITVQDVHRMLGTADSKRLRQLVLKLLERDAASALAEIDQALSEGVEAGAVAEQLLGSFRDLMAAAVGCQARLLLSIATNEFAEFQGHARQVGLENLLAILQILDQTLVRMRQSVHARTLLEMAVVRICRLEDLNDLASLIADLRTGPGSASLAAPRAPSHSTPSGASETRAIAPPGIGPPSERTPPPRNSSRDNDHQAGQSRAEPLPSHEPLPTVPHSAPFTAQHVDDSVRQTNAPAPAAIALNARSLNDVWRLALESLGDDMTGDHAATFDRLVLASPSTVCVSFQEKNRLAKTFCEAPDRRARIENAIGELTGQRVSVQFTLAPDRADHPVAKPIPAASVRQRDHLAAGHPLVRKTLELFSAEVLRTEHPRQAAPIPESAVAAVESAE